MLTAHPLLRWLAGRPLYWLLLALNALVVLAVTALMYRTVTPDDRYTYFALADGLLHGRYSLWYLLPDYVPDTFRNPGYPGFLYLVKLLGGATTAIYLVQVALYAGAVALVLRIAAYYEAAGSWLVRNVLLLLLLPNLHLLYLAFYIYPEILNAFLLVAYGAVALTWPPGTWRRTVALALLAGLIFQVRPVFVLFPLVQLALDYWRSRPLGRRYWVQAGALLLLFGATMLPYAAWNHRHHGVWKVTSIEGGAGVTELGFWALRMPGYRETRYWGNVMGDEVIPFADPAAVPGYIAAFNREWDAIDAQCRPLLTAGAARNLKLMRAQDQATGSEFTYFTYNSAYTLRREQLLVQATLADIRREPGYYFKTRLYTLVRLWVTGVQRPAWLAATTPVAKLKVLFPTLISGFTFLLGLACAGWGLLHRRQLRPVAPAWWLSLAVVVYFGLLHLPFSIQARYTVPARPWLLLLIALTVAAWLRRREAGPTAPPVGV